MQCKRLTQLSHSAVRAVRVVPQVQLQQQTQLSRRRRTVRAAVPKRAPSGDSLPHQVSLPARVAGTWPALDVLTEPSVEAYHLQVSETSSPRLAVETPCLCPIAARGWCLSSAVAPPERACLGADCVGQSAESRL